ncbi:MAG: hypothetical protein RIT45_3212 [Pseudomonadota bacterium]
MMVRKLTSLLALALVVALGACSDDGPTTSGNGGGGAVFDGTGSDLGNVGDTGGKPSDSTGGGGGTGGGTDTVAPDVGKTWVACEYDQAWGCPCEKSSDCDSGFCVQSADGKVCSQTCIEDCPPAWQCLQAGANDATYICLPKFATLCQPCSEHADCGTQGATGGDSKCIPFDLGDGTVDGSFCGAPCSEANACPDGFSCKSVGLPGELTVTQCLPDTMQCTCNKSAVGNALATGCKRENEFGVCTGIRQCTTDGLTLCTAALPAIEVCDGDDNDCDGETDEDGALGCKVFYPDGDNDGSGIGSGQCLCANPGPGYATTGGDCNDVVASIGPQAKEICNDIDDNCNGATDEPQSSGCTVYYLDKDVDGFGDPDDAACLCASKKTQEYVEIAGDCDDTNDKIKPGVPELCNGKDDNCDGKTDEENADGCKLYYLDVDNDGFGPTDSGVCLCGPDAIYPVDKPGDCDDTNDKVKPSAIEVCNNVDDDCNSQTDDGDAPKSCPSIAGVTAACSGGVCGIGNCPQGLFDVDGKYENGCECQADQNYGVGGATCQAAIQLQPLGDGGTSVKVTGNLMPGETADWYTFKALDGPDTNDCDTFNVRAKLVQGDDVYVLDLYRGSCAGKSQICTGETDTGWTVNFGDKPAFGPFTEKGEKRGKVKPSPEPFPAGECKCTTTNHPDGPGLPGMNLCTDNTATFYVAVRYKDNQKPVCQPYGLLITNGIP